MNRCALLLTAHRPVFVSAVAGMLLLASAAPSLAAPTTSPATPPATAHAGRTDHDLLREIAEFDAKYVVDAYERNGHHDPKWDEAALKLVHAQYEASIHNTDLGGHYTPMDRPEPMDAESRAALAEQVIEAGCDDPMVLFLAGCALEESATPRANCNVAFARADELAGNSAYLPLYKMIMFHKAMERHTPMDEGDERLAKLRERFRLLLRQTLTDRETLPKYRAVVWAKAAFVFEDSDNDRVDRIATAIEDVDGPDPWLFDTYMGHVAIQRAWKARGGGWANTVTQAGWKKFAEQLAIARQRLTRASELDPNLPHPAALMITVAMGESAQDAEDWFRESTKRQIDYPHAYLAYRSVVQPRWGGSLARQLSLAELEVATGRFDTRVPGLAIEMAEDLERDAGRPLTVEELDMIAPLIDEAMTGYASADRPPHIRSWANSTRVVWLYMTERYAEARKVLDGMTQIENGPAAYRGIEAGEIIGHIFAMTSPQADAIRDAMKIADAKTRLARLKEIAAVLPEVDEAAADSIQPLRGKSASNWLKRRIVEAEFEASLAGGEWKPLPIAPDLAGWQVWRGEWKADGDALIGRSHMGMTIVAPFQMPERFEFRCTIEPLDEGAKAIYVFPVWSPATRLGAYAHLGDGGGCLIRQNYNYGKFPLAREGNRTTLRLRYDRGQLSALDEASSRLVSADMPPSPLRRPAFGGTIEGGDVTWRFSDIAVRALE